MKSNSSKKSSSLSTLQRVKKDKKNTFANNTPLSNTCIKALDYMIF